MRLQATTSHHRYHIEIAGAGQPLLLLHGFSGDCATWHSAANTLADRWRVIMLDSLGHGKSDAPPGVECYHMAPLAADITDLLDSTRDQVGRICSAIQWADGWRCIWRCATQGAFAR